MDQDIELARGGAAVDRLAVNLKLQEQLPDAGSDAGVPVILTDMNTRVPTTFEALSNFMHLLHLYGQHNKMCMFNLFEGFRCFSWL